MINNYSKMLKEFCHFYQIPFIENNIQKTTYDAAKIYYKLDEDKIKIPEKFNWVVGLISSIPKADVEDAETTYKMKDKWMKFFKSGYQKIEIDQNKAIRNKYSEILEAYISDTLEKFTDENLVRVFDMIDEYSHSKSIRLLDRVFFNLHNKIINKNFNFDSESTTFEFCHAYMKKHNHYFLFQEESQSSVMIDSQLIPSEFVLKCTFLSDNEVQDMIYKIFSNVEPYIIKHFSKYDINQQIIILVTLQKLDINNRELSLEFLKNVKKTLSQEIDSKTYLRLYDKYENDYSNLNCEFINALEYAFTNVPKSKNPVSKKMVSGIISDYFDYIEKNHILSFQNSHQGKLTINLKKMITEEQEQVNLNNKVLEIINNDIEYMKEGILKFKPSNITLTLKEINPNKCDKKLFLQVLSEVSAMVVAEYDNYFNDLAFKDSVLTLTHYRGYGSKLYFVNRMVEIRDSILALMEMHQNCDCQLAGESVLFNKSLFDAYLNMITILYSLEESQAVDEGYWFNSLRVVNQYKTYKYLHNPEMIKYVTKKGNKQETSENIKEAFNVTWNPNYLMYIYFSNESKFGGEYLFKLRNRIFYSINNLKKSFEEELEGFDLDVLDFQKKNDGVNLDQNNIEHKQLHDKIIESKDSLTKEDADTQKEETENKPDYFRNRVMKNALLRLHLDFDLFFDFVNRRLKCNMTNNAEVVGVLHDILKITSKLKEIPGIDMKFAFYPIFENLVNFTETKNLKLSSKIIEEIKSNNTSPNIPYKNIVFSINSSDPVIRSSSYLIKYNDELREKIEILNDKFEQYVNKKQRDIDDNNMLSNYNKDQKNFIKECKDFIVKRFAVKVDHIESEENTAEGSELK